MKTKITTLIAGLLCICVAKSEQIAFQNIEINGIKHPFVIVKFQGDSIEYSIKGEKFTTTMEALPPNLQAAVQRLKSGAADKSKQFEEGHQPHSNKLDQQSGGPTLMEIYQKSKPADNGITVKQIELFGEKWAEGWFNGRRQTGRTIKMTGTYGGLYRRDLVEAVIDANKFIGISIRDKEGVKLESVSGEPRAFAKKGHLDQKFLKIKPGESITIQGKLQSREITISRHPGGWSDETFFVFIIDKVN